MMITSEADNLEMSEIMQRVEEAMMELDFLLSEISLHEDALSGDEQMHYISKYYEIASNALELIVKIDKK